GGGRSRPPPMHIKLSTPRNLLWHYRVATRTIMPANKELPDDDHTTGGPCHARDFDHDGSKGWADHALFPAYPPPQWCHLQPDLGVWVSRQSPSHPGRTHPNGGRVRRRDQPPSAGSTLYGLGRSLSAPSARDRHRARDHGRARRHSPAAAVY